MSFSVNVDYTHFKQDMDAAQERVMYEFPDKALTALANSLIGNLSSEAPRASGALASSFYEDRISATESRVLSTVPYAPFVDTGTNPSPGGYVPALRARLVSVLGRWRITSPKLAMHPGIKGTSYVAIAVAETIADAGEKIDEYLKAAGATGPDGKI